MSSPQFSARTCRPREHLVAAGKLYPGAWRLLDQFRADRGRGGLPDWPDYVYCPMAGAYAAVCADQRVPRLAAENLHLAADVGRLAALGAWRATQGIYRYDPALYSALTETPISGDLPCEALRRLPEWCIYVETPGLRWHNDTLHGVFAHLEYDANNGHEELRLLIDADDALTPIPLHLGAWPLAEGINRMLDTAGIWALTAGTSITGEQRHGMRDALSALAPPLLSLILYLCADESEIGSGQRRPANPEPKRTRHGWRLFPADRVTTWDVGVRLGAALRVAYARADTATGTGTHARPRAHIRRAHWHTFLAGPRASERERRIKWLPPLPINVDDVGDLPATIRKVLDVPKS